jgi:hypothetical protein
MEMVKLIMCPSCETDMHPDEGCRVCGWGERKK